MGFGDPRHQPSEGLVNLELISGLSDADFRAPDLIGTVEGWRAWRIAAKPPLYGTCPKLMSAAYAYFWAPRVKSRAECSKGFDHVPGEDCMCGFYAASTLDHLREMGYSNYNENSDAVTVVGQLAMWGKVIAGTQGWRSEFAYPVRMFVPFEAWKLAKPLREGYGVPVSLLNLLDPDKHPDDGRPV
jgi:hypothetical protein